MSFVGQTGIDYCFVVHHQTGLAKHRTVQVLLNYQMEKDLRHYFQREKAQVWHQNQKDWVLGRRKAMQSWKLRKEKHQLELRKETALKHFLHQTVTEYFRTEKELQLVLHRMEIGWTDFQRALVLVHRQMERALVLLARHQKEKVRPG